MRILRGSRHLNHNTPTHWVVWLAASFACTLVAYIVGSAIPILDSIISLVGALIAPMLCIIPFGFMWWHDNMRGQRFASLNAWMKLNAVWAAFVVFAGMFITVGGTYGAIVTIINQESGGKPWGCADNSNST